MYGAAKTTVFYSMLCSVAFTNIVMPMISVEFLIRSVLCSGECCKMLYCTVLYCIVLYCTVLYCTVLYSAVLYCIVLYCTVLYCTVLCYTILHFTVLYLTVQYLQCVPAEDRNIFSYCLLLQANDVVDIYIR